jgi:hypothetical protein
MFAICSPYNKTHLHCSHAENNFLAKAAGIGWTRQTGGSRIKFFCDASETLAQRGFPKTDFAKSSFQRT